MEIMILLINVNITGMVITFILWFLFQDFDIYKVYYEEPPKGTTNYYLMQMSRICGYLFFVFMSMSLGLALLKEIL